MNRGLERYWDNVGQAQFDELMARSNPLRDAWSDGEVYYEMQGNHKVELGWRTLGGNCYVPPEGMKRWRTA